MPLLRDGAVVADGWTHLDAGAPAPDDGAAITVDGARWAAERQALIGRNGPVGVVLANTDPVALVAADLARLGLVVLAFPKFTDGRAYSQARRLRAAGYQGELRARGQVLRDQLLFMVRAGFDAFEIEAADAVERFDAATHEMTRSYQPRRARHGPGPWAPA